MPDRPSEAPAGTSRSARLLFRADEEAASLKPTIKDEGAEPPSKCSSPPKARLNSLAEAPRPPVDIVNSCETGAATGVTARW